MFTWNRAGVQLRRERSLEPHLERDTFAGGVNLSARGRNLEALTEAKSYLVAVSEPQLTPWPGTRRELKYFVAPEHIIAQLTVKAGATPQVRRRHPALIQWLDSVRAKAVQP